MLSALSGREHLVCTGVTLRRDGAVSTETESTWVRFAPLTPEQIRSGGFDAYFVDHTTGVYPQAASGTPFSVATLQSTGDALADLFEDMAAEQKARLTYDNLLRLLDDPDVRDPIKFLREREIVHFQRFGEVLRDVQENLDAKNYYAYNPSFDVTCTGRKKKC